MTLTTEIPDCPLRAEAEATLQSSRDLNRQLKRFSRLMQTCRKCSLWQGEPACPVMTEINAQLDQALRELNQTWALAAMQKRTKGQQ